MVNDGPGQAAPDRLEAVRELLNTWLIPNDTRTPEDRFDAYATQQHLAPPERDQIRRLRDELRIAVERPDDAPGILNGWIERLDVRPAVGPDGIGYQHRAGTVGQLVVACLDAVAAGRWRRLKACPDCRWVFYDHTRNAGKRWCLMTAGGPGGRSCGSIAKVRAHRRRTRGE
ncbi:CGNR zinc finger domain-containing protein [Phytoactinopolyspora limicola]|uniref:CGNR zinc finger domain-containing protein n=1 Tax=Phytoactinopolyspora limicola TaxID=2715536 RepID=UPI00140777A7|nr:CGNR zinc finger domain-containing protein [Phytoactinopolyspora limicola]